VVGGTSVRANVAPLSAGGDDAVTASVARLIEDAVAGRFSGWASGAS